MSGAQLTVMRTKVNFGTSVLTLETASHSSLAFLTDREKPVTTLDLFSGFGGWTSMAMRAGSIKLNGMSQRHESWLTIFRLRLFPLMIFSTDQKPFLNNILCLLLMSTMIISTNVCLP